jgi:hypothetical protein
LEAEDLKWEKITLTQKKCKIAAGFRKTSIRTQQYSYHSSTVCGKKGFHSQFKKLLIITKIYGYSNSMFVEKKRAIFKSTIKK